MFADDLKNLRKKRGLTQKSLSQIVNVSPPTVALIEKGHGSISSLEKILVGLNAEIWGISLKTTGTLSQRVSHLRKKKGISQRKVSNIIGTTQATISKIETTGIGHLNTIIQIARVCGCEIRIKPKQDPLPFYTDTALRSVNEIWLTPPEIIKSLNKVFGQFDLDPCAETKNLSKIRSQAKLCYTAKDNGLTKSWFGCVFVNPPYSRELGVWINKCRKEVEEKRASHVICLIASRTDTKWWHENIVNKAQVFFIRGRLKFGDGKQSAPFPSALVIWGDITYDKDQLNVLLNAWSP